MRTILLAALLLLAGLPVRACPIAGPLVTALVGKSDAGQWFVSWDAAQDVGAFNGTATPTITRTFCYVIGRPMSLATIGTRVQAINRAADVPAALAAAWAQYVTTPLDDPKMAAALADFRAHACPQLLPFVPQVCR